MSKIIDPLHYFYILENNDKQKSKFFYKINATNSFLNKQDFKNFINFLKTQKKLKWKLKKAWCISPANKRILYIEFGGLYANFWNTGKGLKDYHDLFINN
jgi:hypothetical protein